MTPFRTVITKILFLTSVLTFSTSLLALEEISISVGEWPPYITYGPTMQNLTNTPFKHLGFYMSSLLFYSLGIYLN